MIWYVLWVSKSSVPTDLQTYMFGTTIKYMPGFIEMEKVLRALKVFFSTTFDET